MTVHTYETDPVRAALLAHGVATIITWSPQCETCGGTNREPDHNESRSRIWVPCRGCGGSGEHPFGLWEPGDTIEIRANNERLNVEAIGDWLVWFGADSWFVSNCEEPHLTRRAYTLRRGEVVGRATIAHANIPIITSTEYINAEHPWPCLVVNDHGGPTLFLAETEPETDRIDLSGQLPFGQFVPGHTAHTLTGAQAVQ